MKLFYARPLKRKDWYSPKSSSIDSLCINQLQTDLHCSVSLSTFMKNYFKTIKSNQIHPTRGLTFCSLSSHVTRENDVREDHGKRLGTPNCHRCHHCIGIWPLHVHLAPALDQGMHESNTRVSSNHGLLYLLPWQSVHLWHEWPRNGSPHSGTTVVCSFQFNSWNVQPLHEWHS